MHLFIRWAAVMLATFAAFIAFGWLSLVVWDRTHPPLLPQAAAVQGTTVKARPGASMPSRTRKAAGPTPF